MLDVGTEANIIANIDINHSSALLLPLKYGEIDFCQAIQGPVPEFLAHIRKPKPEL